MSRFCRIEDVEFELIHPTPVFLYDKAPTDIVDVIERYYLKYLPTATDPIQYDLLTDKHLKKVDYQISPSLHHMANYGCGRLYSKQKIGIQKPKLWNMWINDYKKGTGEIPHVNKGSILTAVYFVRCDEHSQSLILKTPDTIREHHSTRTPVHTIAPKKGRIVVFPSWMTHYIPRHDNDTNYTTVTIEFVGSRYMTTNPTI